MKNKKNALHSRCLRLAAICVLTFGLNACGDDVYLTENYHEEINQGTDRAQAPQGQIIQFSGWEECFFLPDGTPLDQLQEKDAVECPDHNANADDLPIGQPYDQLTIPKDPSGDANSEFSGSGGSLDGLLGDTEHYFRPDLSNDDLLSPEEQYAEAYELYEAMERVIDEPEIPTTSDPVITQDSIISFPYLDSEPQVSTSDITVFDPADSAIHDLTYPY